MWCSLHFIRLSIRTCRDYTPEEDGILVKNGNTDELADAICRLIEDTDKRIRMGKQAQKNIQRYLREEVMKLWDELFNTLTTTRL